MTVRIFPLLFYLPALLLTAATAVAQKTGAATKLKSPASEQNFGDPAPQPTVFVLPAGTFIALETSDGFASDRLKKGQTVQLRVRSDVRVEGQTLIRTGAIAYAVVTDLGNNFSYNDPAYITLSADQVQTADGAFVKLHGKPETIIGENPRSTVSIEPMYLLTGHLMNNEKVIIIPD